MTNPPSLSGTAQTAPPLSLLENGTLFLDFDGTLVDIAASPDAIIIPSGLPLLLARLHRALGGRLAIVSGRSVAALKQFGLSGYYLAGSHGLELAPPDTEYHPPLLTPALQDARAALVDFAATHAGLLVENKTAGVALHFRTAPWMEAQCRDFCGELAQKTGLYLQQGKCLFELRPAGANKGTAVENLLRLPPFSGGNPLFIGDDITDEDGFRASINGGGTAILVGQTERISLARWKLPDVASVHHWLAAATNALDTGMTHE